MKLTYRSHSYKIPTPIQPESNPTDQPSIQLIYRGHTYATSDSAAVAEVVESEEKTVTLTYRGNAYEHCYQSSPQPSQQPSAIGWLYRTHLVST